MIDRVSNFDRMLDLEPRLKGFEDFISRIPFYWYNQMSEVGTMNFKERFLRFVPRNSLGKSGMEFGDLREEGSELDLGLILAGHHLSFRRGEGLSLYVHSVPTFDAVHSSPDKNYLRKLLEKPSDVSGVMSDEGYKFAAGILCKDKDILIQASAIDREDSFKGKPGKYWGSFAYNIARPLGKTLWRF